jgi:hypothetical protein
MYVMDKYLLVISKDYWGTSTSQNTALRFMDKFKKFVCLSDANVKTLLGDNVTVTNVKNVIYDATRAALSLDLDDNLVKLYIYMNGHGNQVVDTSGDEKVDVYNGESPIDSMDEVYQLPDGNVVDDDITDIINRAVIDSCSDKRLLVILISDHCSSGSMIDRVCVNYDWVTIGSSLDNQDSYVTGDGNVMTNMFLSTLDKCDNKISVIDFYKCLDQEMKMSYIGCLQLCALHVCNEKMLDEMLF